MADIPTRPAEWAGVSQRQMDDLKTMLDERHRALVKAADTASTVSGAALAAALTAADKAVQTALQAAKEAALKAEQATDKRFADLTDKMDLVLATMASLELRVTSRLDLTQGRAVGLDKSWGYLLGAVTLVGAVIAIILSVTP